LGAPDPRVSKALLHSPVFEFLRDEDKQFGDFVTICVIPQNAFQREQFVGWEVDDFKSGRVSIHTIIGGFLDFSID
jgi:hypothetical protein